MKPNKAYRPAPLTEEDIAELKVQEAFLSERFGEPIILIAYQKAPAVHSLRSGTPARRRQRRT